MYRIEPPCKVHVREVLSKLFRPPSIFEKLSKLLRIFNLLAARRWILLQRGASRAFVPMIPQNRRVRAQLKIARNAAITNRTADAVAASIYIFFG